MDTLLDTVVTEDNCTSVMKCERVCCCLNWLVYLQVDLICEGDSEGNGVKVTPRIGYNCHNILMEEMEKLVEASSGCEGQYLAVYNQNLKIYLYIQYDDCYNK